MTMQQKRSGTPGKVPLTTDLAAGQIAMNTADAILFMKKTVGGTDSVVRVGAEMSAAVAAALKQATLPEFRAAIGAGWTQIAEIDVTGQSAAAITGIPADMQEISIQFYGVKTATDAANILAQIGTSDGYQTASYVSASAYLAQSTAVAVENTAAGFVVNYDGLTAYLSGTMNIRKTRAGTMMMADHAAALNSAGVMHGFGLRSITGLTIDRVRLTPGTGNFSEGIVCISYR